MSTRTLAIQCLTRVIQDKKSLDDALATAKLDTLSARDQGFVRELCFGTLRFYEQLKQISGLLLHKPLPPKNQDVLIALMLGLYQIIYLKTPPHAAISETVNAIKKQKKWAAGLINKTLRVFCETSQDFINTANKHETAAVNHPHWLIKLIKRDWPTHASEIFNANNHKAPMCLRINPQLTSVEKYLNQLDSAGIRGIQVEELPFAILLDQAQPVSKLPQFNQGYCYVQDSSGQYVAQLLQLEPNLTVLDACAAPGSKTTDLLASEPKINHIVALDKDKDRLEKVKQNFERLTLPLNKVELITADASEVDSWWQGQLFDRILIDAPCSATGVIRRHPDIKLLRKETDLKQLVALQRRLLTELWPLLKPNGLLLYTTCSVLKQENSLNLEAFVSKHTDAKPVPIKIPGAYPQKIGLQLLPQIESGDGFYYALLRKNKI